MDEILIRVLIFILGVMIGREMYAVIVRKQFKEMVDNWIASMKKIVEEKKNDERTHQECAESDR